MEHMSKPGEWLLKLEYSGTAPEMIACTGCNGKGHYSGLARSWDGDDDDDNKCKECYGNGKIRNPAWITPIPPKELVDTLSKVMRDAWNKAQNETFELK